MLPKLLDTRLRSVLGVDYEAVMTAFANQRTASFRVNTLKSSEEAVDAIIAREGFRVTKFEAMPGTYLLDPEDEFKFKGSALFREGLTYMQSLSSLLPPLAFDYSPRMAKVLDICAAPGSKTTQMAALMGNKGEIVALEQSPVRYDKLMHNAKLQGTTNIRGIRMDARKFLDETNEMFDAILLDAPCSAEGRIKLDDERSYGFFSLDNIRKKSDLQLDLLLHAFMRLRPNGILVYSTCTLSPEENEGVITQFLSNGKHAVLEPIDFPFANSRPGLKIVGSRTYHEDIENTVRILPSEFFEGFYIAKIRKTGL